MTKIDPVPRDPSTTVEELVLLRETVETWIAKASAAVTDFHRTDGSFWKDSKSAKENTDSWPNITSSARAYVALVSSDRSRDTTKIKSEPAWAKYFDAFITKMSIGKDGDRLVETQRPLSKSSSGRQDVNTFDIAHLADFFQVAEYLKRFYALSPDYSKFFGETKSANKFGPAKFDPRKDIERRLRDGIKDAAKSAGGIGEVCFEKGRDESRHFFATLHSLRALQILGATNIDGLPVVIESARTFAVEQAYYFQRGTRHRQDPIRLAFAGCIYSIYGENVDRDLCLAIVEALSTAQQENGSWPATHPIFRQNNVPWHVTSHEVALCLTWLYFQPKVPDAARPLLIAMMSKYLQHAVIPTFRTVTNPGKSKGANQYRGWQDDHTVSSTTTVGWATAIVCHFLAGFSQVLDDWINRCVIEDLGLQLSTERYLIDETSSSPSTKWSRTDSPYVWPDLPPLQWSRESQNEADVAAAISSAWTDPSPSELISHKLASNVLAPIIDSPGARPRRDRCAGLMSGSAGTRKTSLVKQVASVLRWPMVAVPASTIFERGFDMMEAQASRVFGRLNLLRSCVIFFDEFEEFFLSRGESGETEAPKEQEGVIDPSLTGVKTPVDNGYSTRTIAAFTTSAMLPRLQDLHDQTRCLIFLATNYPEKLDPAIKRQGRFDFTLPIGHPDAARIVQYLSSLSVKRQRDAGLTESGVDAAKVISLISKAVGDLDPQTQMVKFATAEALLRDVRPGMDAVVALNRKLSTQDDGNPPDLKGLE